MASTKILFFVSTIQIFVFLKSVAQTNQPVIDMHMHFYSAKSFGTATPFKSDGLILEASENWSSHVTEMIEKMDKHNITLAYASGDFEIIDYLNKSYPKRFFPSAEISPTKELFTDQNFLTELKKRIEKKEILGIGEVLNFYTGLAPNDPLMDTIYRIAQEYDIPVALHFAPGPTGVQTLGFTNARYRYSNPLLLEDVLVKFPKLRINIMHAGVPAFTEETFVMFYMFPNVYADIGFLAVMDNYNRASLRQLLLKAVDYGFTDRIMFGSDAIKWPSAIDVGINYIKNADFLTEAQKQDILYNNAARFLRLSE